MNNLVVDASVVIESFVFGSYTEQVLQFFETEGAQYNLIFPEFGLLECTNVVWKRVLSMV